MRPRIPASNPQLHRQLRRPRRIRINHHIPRHLRRLPEHHVVPALEPLPDRHLRISQQRIGLRSPHISSRLRRRKRQPRLPYHPIHPARLHPHRLRFLTNPEIRHPEQPRSHRHVPRRHPRPAKHNLTVPDPRRPRIRIRRHPQPRRQHQCHIRRRSARAHHQIPPFKPHPATRPINSSRLRHRHRPRR